MTLTDIHLFAIKKYYIHNTLVFDTKQKTTQPYENLKRDFRLKCMYQKQCLSPDI